MGVQGGHGPMSIGPLNKCGCSILYSDSAIEDLQISEKWDFLREITITSSLVMFIVYLAVGAMLGGQVSDWIVIFGGNDFSLWAIISGAIGKLF